jgi:hypothetical protein
MFFHEKKLLAGAGLVVLLAAYFLWQVPPTDKGEQAVLNNPSVGSGNAFLGAGVLTEAPVAIDRSRANEAMPSAAARFTEAKKTERSEAALIRELCAVTTNSERLQEVQLQLLKNLPLQTVMANVHFTMKTGEQRRVQKLLDESDNIEYRFYTLDSEGYPDLWRPKNSNLPSESILQLWKKNSQSSVLASEIQVSHDDSSDTHVRIVRAAGVIRELDYNSPGVTFSCSQQKCHCL